MNQEENFNEIITAILKLLVFTAFLFIMGLLLHKAGNWARSEQIKEYEQIIAHGEIPQYTICGIPVEYSPYNSN